MTDAEREAWREVFRAWNSYDFADGELVFFEASEEAPTHFRYGVASIGDDDPLVFLDTMTKRLAPEGVLAVISTTPPPESHSGGRWWHRSLTVCPSPGGWLYIRQ